MQIVSFLLRILRAAFWICLLFALDVPYLSVFTLLAMLWHELFHLLAFMRIARHARLCTHLSGLRLFPSDVLSYRDERRTAAAGPIGGLFGALLCIVFLPLSPSYLSDFAFCHLFTTISNLLPLEGYDGYRILHTTLALRDTADAEALMRQISFVCSAILALLSLFLFGILGEGLWASGAFLSSLIGSLPEKKTFSHGFLRKTENSGEFGRFSEKTPLFTKEKQG